MHELVLSVMRYFVGFTKSRRVQQLMTLSMTTFANPAISIHPSLYPPRFTYMYVVPHWQDVRKPEVAHLGVHDIFNIVLFSN